MAAKEVEDDGVSFSSEITIEPEDETTVATGASDTRRAHWAPDVVDRRLSRVRAPNNGQNRSSSAIPDSSGEGETVEESSAVKIGKVVLELLPSLAITCVVQLIDLMVGVSLYLIGLVICQAIFWPSLGFLLYSRFFENVKILEPISTFKGGHWVNLFMLQIHAIVMVVNILLMILSIQYLDITVALALTFLPCLVILLMEHIQEEKSCSLELLATLAFAYTGVIIVTIPALLTEHALIEKRHYSGIAASIGSSFLTIEASFILKYLKRRNVDESLMSTSTGLQGTIICVLIGGPLKVLGPLTPINAGYISVIFLLVALAAFLGVIKLSRRKFERICVRGRTTEEESQVQRESENVMVHYSSISRIRAFVFLLSCVWGLFKQFYRHTLPSIFSVLGVTLIIASFLFATAYREWHALTKREIDDSVHSNENRPKNVYRKTPFQFIPWLFSREPILYIH